jgi:putative membrane-bound dehydrogenase-like protein
VNRPARDWNPLCRARTAHSLKFPQVSQSGGRFQKGISPIKKLDLSPFVLVVVTVLLSVTSRAGQVTVDGRNFTLPDGFVIDRVAGPPLVNRPITAAFDDAGRLYVADSSGSNDNVQKQLADKPHRIVRLLDSDGDGKFDRQTVFADKMMFPEGTMWHDGSLYVSAPPSIWKLTDKDGDGVAEERVEWFQGKTLTGCANDLHGPYPGPDGWIYWCKGAFARQTYERSGKSPLVTRAAHIFRCRPDGTGIEPVMTGGMDNPVDLVFTPGGERIFTTTFFVHPSGGQRDGLIHAIYGGICGKVHDPIFDPAHKWTSPQVMPVLLHMGPAAPCGLVRYESDSFGKDYENNLFACYFNLHKVSRHVLTHQDATFTTKDEDFVTSPDLDFHPTDVIEDAGGGLIVVDTGGWYKLCCPTSQLHKPDVLGAVYRVRRRDAKKTDDPCGLALSWKTMTPAGLVNRLDDARPTVRKRAIEHLAKLGEPAVAPLASWARFAVGVGAGPENPATGPRRAAARVDRVWAACRIDQPGARAIVRSALDDPDELVRQAAIHAAGLWRDREAVARLTTLLAAPSIHNRRAAAEALGRIGDAHAVAALLDAAGQTIDRTLEHSIRYALIEIADPAATAAGLDSKNWRVSVAAMVALDEMDGGRLEPKFVAERLASTEPAVKDTAAWIIGRHVEWTGALAGVLGRRLDQTDLPPAERALLERQLGQFAQAKPIQQLLAARVSDSAALWAVRESCLKAMAWSDLKPNQLPAAWIAALVGVLSGEGSSTALVPQAVATARALALTRESAGDLPNRLLKIGADAHQPAKLRLASLAAVPGGVDHPDEVAFTFLLAELNRDQPVAIRTTAADVLARARLSPSQLHRLSDALATAGPLEVDRLLAAFEQSTDQELGLKLLKALAESPALSSLRVDALKTHLAKYGPEVKSQAEALCKKLNVDASKQQARLEQLMTTLSAGDIRRGQLVFHSDKAACFSCHAIGYRGGTVGPDLTRVGSIRSERDLMESIVFPSASLVRSFEPIAVATSDGKVTSGLLRGETADDLVLATGVNQEARIARRQIEEIRPSTVSIMPGGLDQQLSPQELADLIAFLKACK